MALTGKLGVADSQLGNIRLGGGASTTLDNVADNTLVISQSAVASFGIIARSLTSTLTLSHTNYVLSAHKRVTQTFTITQAVDDVEVYARALSHTFSPFHTNAAIRLTLAENTLTLTDEATVEKYLGVNHTITLTQSATHQYNPHFDSVQQIFTITQSAQDDAVFSRSLTSTYTPANSVVGFRVRNESVSNTYVVTHLAANVKILRPSNALTLSHAASQVAVKSRSLISTLVLSHDMDRQVIYTRSLVSEIVYPSVHQRNGVQVPSAQVTVPKRYVKYIFADRIIVLPVPLLDDTEGLTNELKIKRSINGSTYTYVRRNKDRKLKYDFSIDRAKAYELRSYVDLTAGQQVKLQNWKGEIWVGYITNNPFDLATESRGGSCGDRYAVSIEFDGVRIH